MIEIGEKITQQYKQKAWSKTESAKPMKASKEAIGKIERNAALFSLEPTHEFAGVFDVTLDHHAEDITSPTFAKKTAKRLNDLQLLGENDLSHDYALWDAFLTRTKIKSIL